jgi:hypothetical protein
VTGAFVAPSFTASETQNASGSAKSLAFFFLLLLDFYCSNSADSRKQRKMPVDIRPVSSAHSSSHIF